MSGRCSRAGKERGKEKVERGVWVYEGRISDKGAADILHPAPGPIPWYGTACNCDSYLVVVGLS